MQTNDVLMLAGSLRSLRIIRQVLRQLGYDSPAIFKWIKKKQDYFRGIGSVSLFIQRIGSLSAMLVA